MLDSQNKQKLLEKKFLTALIGVTGIGCVTVKKIKKFLQNYQISTEEFWVGKNEIWRKIGLDKRQIESIKNFQKAYTINSYYESILEKNISVLTYKDKNYPQLLKPLNDKPVVLFCRGRIFETGDIKTGKAKQNQIPWNENPIAVVGTRRITSYGSYVTQKITKELLGLGGTIVSGFMYGVDVAAHTTAIESAGQTVGVLGYGFDQVGPYSQRKLFDRMLEKGMMFVSEYPPHISASTGTFPVRNRIIAGMSLGTVVMEAAARSGSLITAQWALDYGREVFAVPGPINSKFSDGTRWLVNEGAKMVGSGKEVVEELEIAIGNSEIRMEQEVFFSKDLSFLEKKIINQLQLRSMQTNELAEKIAGVNLVELINTLTKLEIEGKIVKKTTGFECKY